MLLWRRACDAAQTGCYPDTGIGAWAPLALNVLFAEEPPRWHRRNQQNPLLVLRSCSRASIPLRATMPVHPLEPVDVGTASGSRETT